MKVSENPVARLLGACTLQDKSIGQQDMQEKFETIIRSMLQLVIRPNRHMAVLTVKGST